MFPDAIQLSQVSRSELFTGPLPVPHLLQEYDQVLPGLAERIVRMAEQQGESRRRNESRLIRLSEWGLISALVIALTSIGGGIYLAYEGKPTEGVVAIVGALSALTIVFVVGRNKE